MVPIKDLADSTKLPKAGKVEARQLYFHCAIAAADKLVFSSQPAKISILAMAAAIWSGGGSGLVWDDGAFPTEIALVSWLGWE